MPGPGGAEDCIAPGEIQAPPMNRGANVAVEAGRGGHAAKFARPHSAGTAAAGGRCGLATPAGFELSFCDRCLMHTLGFAFCGDCGVRKLHFAPPHTRRDPPPAPAGPKGPLRAAAFRPATGRWRRRLRAAMVEERVRNILIREDKWPPPALHSSLAGTALPAGAFAPPPLPPLITAVPDPAQISVAIVPCE